MFNKLRHISRLAMALSLALALIIPPAAGAREPVRVKVLVLSMFEVGENSGDLAGEFQYWYENYWTDAASFDVAGAASPVFINKEGVAGTITGMGKARAAASLTSILKDPRFDFSDAWFITSGCAGVSPLAGTLGDVFICDWAVDYDLGHSWKQFDGVAGEPVFLIKEEYRDSASIPLNADLARKAFDTAVGVALRDDQKAKEYRGRYGVEAARSKPSLRTGTSVTGDNYWHGKGSSGQASALCRLYGAPEYGVTQMEDNAFAVVLRSFGFLDRFLIIRAAVNFDRPHDGQTVAESLSTSSGGFSIGMFNGYQVGARIVEDLLKKPEDWKKTLPSSKNP